MATRTRALSSVDCDTVFQALNNVYRRRLLLQLLERSPDEGVRIPEDVHTGRKALAVLEAEMFHKHIPNLQEFGFVRWDQRSDRVVRGPTFDQISSVIELLDQHRERLPRHWRD